MFFVDFLQPLEFLTLLVLSFWQALLYFCHDVATLLLYGLSVVVTKAVAHVWILICAHAAGHGSHKLGVELDSA